MLGTPPAFILSQDQTLDSVVYSHSFERQISYQATELSLALLLAYVDLSKIIDSLCFRNCRDLFTLFSSITFSCYFWCFLSLLFNFQGSNLFVRLSAGDLNIISRSLDFVNPYFAFFSNFLLTFFNPYAAYFADYFC